MLLAKEAHHNLSMLHHLKQIAAYHIWDLPVIHIALNILRRSKRRQPKTQSSKRLNHIKHNMQLKYRKKRIQAPGVFTCKLAEAGTLKF